VADPAAALIDLAAWARDRVTGEVVGITGSVGKTSTKDLVAAAVGAERRVTANERSFNNEQGLPVTILGAPDDTEVLVLEMGMRGFGQIAELCRIGRPTDRRGHRRRRGAHRAGRRDRRGRTGQAGAGRGAARPRAPPC
jgi:UDP-N-acetylmuramoyl-tripeptide--D-alanyl-D-alanine ligase